MAKITRYGGNLQAFASAAQALERTLFGDSAQSDLLDDNINADFLRGWENGTDPNGYPTKQFFNALGFTTTQLLAYLHQLGVAEWHAAQEYNTNSLTNYNGVIYRSLTDANIGNTPDSDSVNWAQSSGGLDWFIKDVSYTARDGEGILLDTSGGSKTITCPATPSEGERFAVADFIGSFGTNNCTIDRNGSNIEGAAADLILDNAFESITLVYSNASRGWVRVTGRDQSIKGNGGDRVFVENDQTVTSDYTITAGKNAMSAGPISIDTGVTVTIPTGSVWHIV